MLTRSIACLVIACMAAACASTAGNALNAVKIRRKGLEVDRLGQFELPDGAGGDRARKKCVLFLALELNEDLRAANADAVPESGKLRAYANQQIEALMPRLKRFTVYSLYNSGGREMVRQLVELGEVEEAPKLRSEMPAPDVILNLKATWGRVKERMQGDAKMDELHLHRTTYTYNLTDASGMTLQDAREASGVIEWEVPKMVAKIVPLSGGPAQFFGGFNPNDTENVHNVFETAFTDVNRGLAQKLALAFPVTAKVTGLSPSGTQFAMAAGTRDGVFNGGKVTVWVQDPGGFDYVIAEAEAQSTIDRTTLKVTGWNHRDPDASRIVRVLQREPSRFKDYTVWATTKDIPESDRFPGQ